MAHLEETPTLTMSRTTSKPFVANIVEHVVMVQLRGEADASNVTDLQVHLRYLTSLRTVRVILDCSGLTGIATQALPALVKFRHALVRDGGDIKFVGLRPSVLTTIEAAGAAKFLGLASRQTDTVWN